MANPTPTAQWQIVQNDGVVLQKFAAFKNIATLALDEPILKQMRDDANDTISLKCVAKNSVGQSENVQSLDSILSKTNQNPLTEIIDKATAWSKDQNSTTLILVQKVSLELKI